MVVQIVTFVKVGVCAHCHEGIRLGKGDLERELSWTHIRNGLRTCPGVPTATPVPGTVADY